MRSDAQSVCAHLLCSYLWRRRWARMGLLPSPVYCSRSPRVENRGIWPRSPRCSCPGSSRSARPSPPWWAGASETRTSRPASPWSSVPWRRKRACSCSRPECTGPRSPAPSGVCMRWVCRVERAWARSPGAGAREQRWRCPGGSVGSPASEARAAGLWWFWIPGVPWTIGPFCQRIAQSSRRGLIQALSECRECVWERERNAPLFTFCSLLKLSLRETLSCERARARVCDSWATAAEMNWDILPENTHCHLSAYSATERHKKGFFFLNILSSHVLKSGLRRLLQWKWRNVALHDKSIFKECWWIKHYSIKH